MKNIYKHALNSVVLLTFIASCLIMTLSTFAADSSGRITLGGGYTCDLAARLIYKGKSNKTVTLSKAKQALTQKISDLGNSKKDKQKKTLLKAAKSYLKPCTDGTLAIPTEPTPTPVSGKPSSPGLDRYCERFPHSPRCR